MKDEPFGFVLGETVRMIVKKLMIKTKACGYSVSIQQFALLHLVHTKNEIIQQELAEFVGKDKSAILRQIDLLEKENLLLRLPDENDRRKNHLKLTPKGIELHAKLNLLDMELEQELLAGIGKEELKTFFDVLAKIKHNARN